MSNSAWNDGGTRGKRVSGEQEENLFTAFPANQTHFDGKQDWVFQCQLLAGTERMLETFNSEKQMLKHFASTNSNPFLCPPPPPPKKILQSSLNTYQLLKAFTQLGGICWHLPFHGVIISWNRYEWHDSQASPLLLLALNFKSVPTGLTLVPFAVTGLHGLHSTLYLGISKIQ